MQSMTVPGYFFGIAHKDLLTLEVGMPVTHTLDANDI